MFNQRSQRMQCYKSFTLFILLILLLEDESLAVTREARAKPRIRGTIDRDKEAQTIRNENSTPQEKTKIFGIRGTIFRGEEVSRPKGRQGRRKLLGQKISAFHRRGGIAGLQKQNRAFTTKMTPILYAAEIVDLPSLAELEEGSGRTFETIQNHPFVDQFESVQAEQLAIETTQPPTQVPTNAPTSPPTPAPTNEPTDSPTEVPTNKPTGTPTFAPTDTPTSAPTESPTPLPTIAPTETPTSAPTNPPTPLPTTEPTDSPTPLPTDTPTDSPTPLPTNEPTETPTSLPTISPTLLPTREPTDSPTSLPTREPTLPPTLEPFSDRTIARNDMCENAADETSSITAIGSAPNIISDTTVGANIPNVNPRRCRGLDSSSPAVWYKVTGTGSTLTASLCHENTEFDTKITIYGGACDSLDCIAANDDADRRTGGTCRANLYASRTEWESEDGATYYILVHGFGRRAGDFGLSLESATP